jgi:uncharacterized delta-60 repeat protein
MIKKLLIFTILFFAYIPAYAQYVDTSWVRRYNGPGNGADVANAITVDSVGNVYVTGYSYTSTGHSYDCVTIKYYPNGDTAWLRRYNGPANGKDAGWDIAVDDSGYVYVSGYSDVDSTSNENDDYLTIRYDRNGNQMWARTIGGPGSEIALALAVDGSGNTFVTGSSSYGYGGVQYDYCTVKYGPDGTRLWVKTYAGSALADDRAYGIAVADTNSIYVTGWSQETGTAADYTTIKYRANGDTVWVRRYHNGYDYASDIALDGSGNICVTGRTAIGGLYDYATVKYNPDGERLWARLYNDQAGGSDLADAIAVDNFNNVFVTGYGDSSATLYDYATVKYDSSGNEQWVKRYNSPDNGYDWAYDIATDATGNVYVTGVKDYSSGTTDDYATVKYDSQGNQLWVKTYNGPANNQDRPNEMAVDRFDNVCVTGYSTGSNSDYCTIKYWQNHSPVIAVLDSNLFWCAPDTIRFTVRVTDQESWDTLSLSGPGITTPLTGPSPLTAQVKLYAGSAGNYNYVYTATDEYGGSDTDTSTWVVTINTSPGAFSLLSPADGVLLPYSVTFDWEAAVDPDTSDQVGYDLYVSTSKVFQADSTVNYDSISTSSYTDSLGRGTYYWKVKANDTCTGIWSNQSWTLFSGMCGDVNGDKVVDVGDVVYMVNYLFKGGAAPNPLKTGNVNSDGTVDVGDIVYLINYLFKNGPVPAC